MNFKWAIVGATFAALSAITAANASVVTYTASGIGPDGAESGKAIITTGNGTITVALSSLTGSPKSDGQELAGVAFVLEDTPSSLTFFSKSATLINIAPGGVVTPNGGAITHWGLNLTGSTATLETAGPFALAGQPHDLIIGSGPYTNANPSITGKNPHIQGVATFVLTAPGVTADTDVEFLKFFFGTSDTNSNFLNGIETPVPEASTWAMMILGFLGVGFMAYRRKQGGPALRMA